MDPKKLFKQKLLAQLYAPYKNCTACPLGSLGRKHVVFGDGDPDAQLMFIGEGPGREEDIQGKPFVGRAGQLLNRSLETLGVQRKDVYITNIVKCRPPNNRTPTPLESQTCKKLLLVKQIKIIRPQVICTLGSAAIQGLLDQTNIKISQVRGKKRVMDGIIIIPTYHPAYILRNPNELKTFITDLELAISMCSRLPKGGG
ncbi:MAG: uracil-DNA glycosylase, partial [Promethearchaeota archaeon]